MRWYEPGLLCLLWVCAVNAWGEPAATNSWTKTTSGLWQESFWSLGAPQAHHTVCFTNSGFKALAVDSNTADGLSVSNLLVSAPANSSNLFFLNFAGGNRPFEVADALIIGPNGGLLSLGSVLRVGDLTRGGLFINGTVAQSDFSDIAARSVFVGHEVPGAYYMSNGWFTADSLTVGGTNYPHGSERAYFVQEGGSASVSRVILQRLGSYSIDSGSLEAFSLVIGQGSVNAPSFRSPTVEPAFLQFGGDIAIDGDIVVGRDRYGAGSYSLRAGLITANSIHIGSTRYAAGEFYQDGGVVVARQLVIAEEAYHPMALPEAFTYSQYVLSNGTISTFGTTIGAGRAGSFRQYGGAHIVDGDLRVASGTDWSYYTLTAGNVSSGRLLSDSARLEQSGGTNEVTAALELLGQSSYTLAGGVLRTGSTAVDSAPRFTAAFIQNGGSHLTDYMGINTSYEISVGELRAREIQLAGTLRHRGGIIVADVVRFVGGRWSLEVTNHSFGLATFFYGTLSLPAGSSRVTFANGSDVHVWTGIALTIENWSGSTNGAGEHQILFAPGSLTPRALSLVWFANPAGFPPGNYPSRMLPSGELVPTEKPTLASTHYGYQTVLSWGGDAVLQSATNVAGPFIDVPSLSPYTISSYDLSQQFFRLRR